VQTLKCILVLLLVAMGNKARGDDESSTNSLTNPKLVNSFYELNENRLVWTGADERSAELRNELAALISKAVYLGLKKTDYHYSYISSPPRLYNDIDADKIFTDAALGYLKDIYTGNIDTRLLGYNEVSVKNDTKDKDILLKGLSKVRDASDLQALAQQMEPDNDNYRTIKTELAVQIEHKAADKIKALSTALNYYRLILHFNFSKYIVVNICNTMLHYYQDGKMVLEMKVVTGKPATKTPRFTAYCYEVILYPYWNVPHSIAVKEIIPSYKKNRNTLNSMNLQVIDKNGKVINPASLNWSSFNSNYFPYRFRQSTGCDNALGVIKFNISDPFSVYLHDTNNKNVFTRSNRYLSHGCIRLEKPMELGNYLLPGKIDMNLLKACIKTETPTTLKMNEPVPVFVIYMPADAAQGAVSYYNDIYHLL